MIRTSLAAIGCICLIGCTKPDTSWLPLEGGESWTYRWTDGLTSDVIILDTNGEVPVGKVRGRKLNSPRGDSILAWDKGLLLAARLGQSEYSPPLPIFITEGPIPWTGTITTAGKSVKGQASISREATEEEIDGKTYKSIEVSIDLSVPSGKHEITTSYVSGLGIVRQEHQEDGYLVSRIVYVSGP